MENDLYQVVQYLGLVGVLLFVMWMSGDDWVNFGLIRPKLGPTLLLALGFLLLALPLYVLTAAIPQQPAEPNVFWFPMPVYGLPMLVGVLNIAVAASYEEIAFRGYLLARFTEIFKSPVSGAILSSIVFGLSHLYQGWVGVAYTTAFGLLACGFAIKARSVYALCLAHSLHNIVVFYGMA